MPPVRQQKADCTEIRTKQADYEAKFRDWKIPLRLRFPTDVAEQQQLQTLLDSELDQHLVIQHPQTSATLCERFSPTSHDKLTDSRQSIARGRTLKEDLFANGVRSAVKSRASLNDEFQLGIWCSYGCIGWSSDHCNNVSLANQFWTWLHEHTGLFVQSLKPLLEPDFLEKLEGRAKGPCYHVRDKMGKDVKAAVRTWWTLATISVNDMSSMINPRRDPEQLQPSIFLNFESDVDLCLQLVKNGPIIRVTIGSSQVAFVDTSTCRYWVEGDPGMNNWVIMLTMSADLANEHKMASIRKNSRSLETLPIVKKLKIKSAKKVSDQSLS